jgi:tRNA dimethylallyltransferase
MQGIGYRHLAPVVTRGGSLVDAVRVMKRDTRRYAKRQWTWFLREAAVQWVSVDPGQPGMVIAQVKKLVERARIFG